MWPLKAKLPTKEAVVPFSRQLLTRLQERIKESLLIYTTPHSCP